MAMATLTSSSSSLLFSSPQSKLPQSSLSPSFRLSFSSSSHLSSSLSSSPSFGYSASPRRSSVSSFTVKGSAAAKKKVLIVNTNSGGHAVIGFYFAKELLGSGHEVTTMTVGDENSDKMKKTPFTRFNVRKFCWISSCYIYLYTYKHRIPKLVDLLVVQKF